MHPDGQSIAVPEPIRTVSTLVDPGYAATFDVRTTPDDLRSAEQWARATFEGAARPIRGFLLIGWRGVLWLRLHPRRSPDYVLGWKIVGRGADWILLEVRSALMTAQQVFWVDEARVVQCTFVRYDRAVAAVVWPPVSLIHRRMVPYLLRRAKSHQ